MGKRMESAESKERVKAAERGEKAEREEKAERAEKAERTEKSGGTGKMPYRSPYEAYPFLCDAADDLRCDFELMTDELASGAGLLRAKVADEELQKELLWICELVYHMNPALRTPLQVTESERDRLFAASERLRLEAGDGKCRFVLTQGCEAACLAHILRVRSKELVRLIYRHVHQGHEAEPVLLDLANLLSGYFFYLALKLNADAGIPEVEFVSRNY